MMGFKPLGWTVLVEETDRDDVSPIIAPDSAKEVLFKKFTVIAKGEPRVAANGREVPIPVEVGDEILVDLRNPSRFHLLPAVLYGGRTLVSMDCDIIRGVMTGKPDRMGPKIKTARELELVH